MSRDTGPLELKLTVAAKSWLTADIVEIIFTDPDAQSLPRWDAGAHIDVQCGDHQRQYSLCGDPDDRLQYRVAVLRDANSRGGSTYVHDSLNINDIVQVSGPRNTFALQPSPRYIFIAGGIGITPVLPMIAAVVEHGSDWALHYGGRTVGGMAFLEQLRAHGDRVTIYPQDDVGHLPIGAILSAPKPNTQVYCCGPAPLLDAVADAARPWDDGALHVERFAPTDLVADAERSFTVELTDSGIKLQVPPDRTILQVLSDAGIDVPSSCEVGTCGTCEATVLAGVPDHRDSVLTAEEREDGHFMMPCVSRSRTDTLVLDL
ncbi:PDR/VanB family oxidoreductase [Gordonia sp. CPCC 205515]|uniref:PDR/VanB family oxidoreductase n=1 Tax=Gordonia sp. CPCC 205515 TaxID=3140791 RepID=UPI003AF3CAF6